MFHKYNKGEQLLIFSRKGNFSFHAVVFQLFDFQSDMGNVIISENCEMKKKRHRDEEKSFKSPLEDKLV